MIVVTGIISLMCLTSHKHATDSLLWSNFKQSVENLQADITKLCCQIFSQCNMHFNL